MLLLWVFVFPCAYVAAFSYIKKHESGCDEESQLDDEPNCFFKPVVQRLERRLEIDGDSDIDLEAAVSKPIAAARVPVQRRTPCIWSEENSAFSRYSNHSLVRH